MLAITLEPVSLDRRIWAEKYPDCEKAVHKNSIQ